MKLFGFQRIQLDIRLLVVSDYPVLSSAAQLACLYTHLSLWRDLLSTRRDDIFLILEDDCHLACGILDALDLKLLPQTLNVVSAHRLNKLASDRLYAMPLEVLPWYAAGDNQ